VSGTVDSHVHLSDVRHTPQRWMTQEHAAIARPFGPGDLKPFLGLPEARDVSLEIPVVFPATSTTSLTSGLNTTVAHADRSAAAPRSERSAP
jgi:hypothetical protein